MSTTPPTIRDYITRRARPGSLLTIGGGVVFGIVISNANRHAPHAATEPVIYAALLVLSLAGIVTGVILLKRVKCPKCNTSLTAIARQIASNRKGRRFNFCPYCAVNLDDPMPQAPTPAEEITTPDKLVWK